MLSRIIVPLDGSQLSHAALPFARALAERAGAAVTLVSVMDPPRDFYVTPQDSSTTRMRPQDVEHLAEEESRLQDYLNRMSTSFGDLRVETDIRLGSAAEEIIHAAELSRNSVIMMASHGRTGLGRMFLGSVASRVVRATHAPVIIVRATSDSQAEYGKQKINHVAVPLDGSSLAEQALDRAYEIFGNEVRYTLVRVVEPVSQTQAYASEAILNYERDARQSAEDYLSTLRERLTLKGATVLADVRVTRPSEGITEVARDFGADLIAMSTHGRTGFGRFLIGSVAERVLHDSDRPVMIVRGVEQTE